MITDNEYLKLRNMMEEVVEQKLEEKLEEKLEPIRQQLKELKPMNKKINKLIKDQKIIINFFDNQVMSIEKRVDRIEDHLHLSSLA